MKTHPTREYPRYLLLLTWTLCSCVSSPEARSAKFVAAGKKLLQTNDAERAILQFRSAAQVTPRSPEIYYQLGIAYVAAGDLRNGVKCLRKALELNPKHVEAQLRLAQLMASTSDQRLLQDAQQRLQELVQNASENADALEALALAELKLGEPDDAMQLLDRAIAAAPQEVLFAATLAHVKVEQNDQKGAEQVLKKACENSPHSADAVIILGRFYAAQNRAAEAEQEFRHALVMDPQSPAALLNIAMLLNATGRKQEAEQDFKRLADSSGKMYKPVHAIFLFQEGRRDEAIREFEKLAREDPEDHLARTRLVDAYRAVHRAPDAAMIVDRALKKNPKDLDALLQRSEMSLAAEKYEDAEADLYLVLHEKPDAAEVHYVAAKLHQARGTLLSYRQELSRALQLNPHLLFVRRELFQDLVRRGQPRAALDLLEETPAAQKQLTAVVVERNWALWALGDLPEMRKGIDIGLARERSTDLLLQDGLWKLSTGKLSQGRAALEEAYQVHPEDLRSLNLLAHTYGADQRAALNLVRDHASRHPKSPTIQYFWSEWLRGQGDMKQARTVLSSVVAEKPNFARAAVTLAGMDAEEGRFQEARTRLQAILKSNSGGHEARLMLAKVEQAAGNWSGAIEAYKNFLAIGPQDVEALNNLAYLLSERANQPDEAFPYAQKAIEAAPGNAAVQDTLGWILYRKGLFSSAVRALENSVKNQHVPVRQYHLAMAYFKGGDMVRGDETLALALRANHDLPEAQLALQIQAEMRGGSETR